MEDKGGEELKQFWDGISMRERVKRRVEGEEIEREGRRSKDRRVNRESKLLVEFVEDREWEIFNGAVQGGEEGEYTFTGGRRNSIIDYVIRDVIGVKNRIKRLTMGDKVDSDG